MYYVRSVYMIESHHVGWLFVGAALGMLIGGLFFN